ncbi:MAG: FlhB [Devosia sp.]|nr:FlhB [Devosia sp.]
MSDEAPEQSSKTEDPSAKKLEDARKRGDVVKSQEVTTWFMLLGSAMIFSMLGPWMASSLSVSMTVLLANADQIEVGGDAFGAFFANLAGSIMLVALLPLTIVFVCAVVANLVQHRPLLSLDPITPKLEKISPFAGAKRLFSSEALVNFLKGVAKIGIVGAVMFFVMWPERDRVEGMITEDPALILADVMALGMKLLWATLVVVTVIAFADFFYQRQKWWHRQMMTVQEVRDEYKQMEGDPKVKGRIRQLRQERSRQRMMQNVPNATVIITNPTHFAVALQYDRDMAAPKCVAKGADAVALRIREKAKEHDIPIVENAPLARALFASVEIDGTIPAEHFKAVAQVIGYVMRLKDKRGWSAS